MENVNELIKIESLPKVFYQLEQIGNEIEKQLKGIDELEVSENTVKEVKKRRTEINNFTKILEERRKEIKKEILKPYDLFNAKYDEECKSKLDEASNLLSKKIDIIENKLKNDKEIKIQEFYNEQIKSYEIENFANYNDVKLNITLSATEKSLKEQVIEYCERILKDLKMIDLEEYKSEMFVEYKQCKDFITAKTNVLNRHKELERIKQLEQEKQQEVDQNKEIISKVEEIKDEIIVPKEIKEEEVLEITFTCKGTREQLKSVKQFLIENGIEYR